MQPVYKDGGLGGIEEFSEERMKELLEKENVDHVKVFNREEGNKVDSLQIKEKDLEKKIDELLDKKLSEHDKRNDMFRGFEMLKAEFDKKRRK